MNRRTFITAQVVPITLLSGCTSFTDQTDPEPDDNEIKFGSVKWGNETYSLYTPEGLNTERYGSGNETRVYDEGNTIVEDSNTAEKVLKGYLLKKEAPKQTKDIEVDKFYQYQNMCKDLTDSSFSTTRDVAKKLDVVIDRVFNFEIKLEPEHKEAIDNFFKEQGYSGATSLVYKLLDELNNQIGSIGTSRKVDVPERHGYGIGHWDNGDYHEGAKATPRDIIQTELDRWNKILNKKEDGGNKIETKTVGEVAASYLQWMSLFDMVNNYENYNAQEMLKRFTEITEDFFDNTFSGWTLGPLYVMVHQIEDSFSVLEEFAQSVTTDTLSIGVEDVFLVTISTFVNQARSQFTEFFHPLFFGPGNSRSETLENLLGDYVFNTEKLKDDQRAYNIVTDPS